MKALCFRHFGGPEVLRLEELPDPAPQPGHAVVRMRAIGLNFADVYRRRGNYHLQGDPPYIAGYEGAGEIAALPTPSTSSPPAASAGVSSPPGPSASPDSGAGGFRLGDRVAFADSPFANAELVRVPFDHLIPLPDDVDFETAAAVLLQGLTAQYLCRDSRAVRSGEDLLIHAAAGGVGLLLVQISKSLGARVLGLASSAPKRDAALAAGADAVSLYGEDWVAAAHRFSRHGAGVDVAYDAVGSTLAQSLAAVRNGGQVVFFGMAGGDPAPVDPRLLMDGSKTLTGGDLWNVLRTREDRLTRAAELFSWLRSGALRVRIADRFPLAAGAAAHAFLESRAAIGKVLLLP